jgi:hypothetical protein
MNTKITVTIGDGGGKLNTLGLKGEGRIKRKLEKTVY